MLVHCRPLCVWLVVTLSVGVASPLAPLIGQCVQWPAAVYVQITQINAFRPYLRANIIKVKQKGVS